MNIFVISFLVLCLLEVSYRYQWIDFYKAEFKALNKKIDPKKDNILVFGDSFAAHPNSFVDQLRENSRKYNFINCAVPGTGPIEMAIMAKGRVKTYKPKKVIYQMYIGNDLLDIQPSINWSKLSFSRNSFWVIKQYFQIFAHLSRRLKGVQSDFDEEFNSQEKEQFSIKNFSPRSKMLIQADPSYLNASIYVNSTMKAPTNIALEKIKYLQSLLPKNCELTVVVLPHFSQINQSYQKRYSNLGAEESLQNAEYPFIKYLKKELLNIEILNPIEHFRKEELKGVKLYFENDPHLSDHGQQVLSAYLENKLFEND